jgi:REP element-mobilizing transposase RayT
VSEKRKTEAGKTYFVTQTVVDWIDLFTRKELAEFIIKNLIHCQQNKNLKIHSWCLMPSHLHMIATGTEKPLSLILRDFKSYTSKQLVVMIGNMAIESRREWLLAAFEKYGRANSQNTRHQVWIQDNNPVQIYSPHVYEQKRLYIENNPVESGLVTSAEYYRYSSANIWSELKTDAW